MIKITKTKEDGWKMMAGIAEDRDFIPLKIAVMTVSDTRTEETDTSGKLLADRLTEAGHSLHARAIVPDEAGRIRAQASDWLASGADIILTTGGTGFAPRDVTPEAIKPLCDRIMDGFSVVFHTVSLQTVGLSTLQSRAFAGQSGKSFIFCMPGSTGACRDAWDNILKFELDARYRPCSIFEILEANRNV